MSNFYQCETTSTTKDKTLAKESNLPMLTIFFAICLIVFIFYRDISNITTVILFNSFINFLNKYGRLFVILLLFILFGILIAAIVNLN